MEKVTPPSALKDMHSLETGETGLTTSEGVLFNNTIFGRDRIISSFDLLDTQPEIARQSILKLAELQGVTENPKSEESLGKIHHEHRDNTWEGGKIAKKAYSNIINPIWGGDKEAYTTYFSADSTPLYIKLVSEYAKRDTSIYDETITAKDGEKISIGESLERAVTWIESCINEEGLVEVKRENILSLLSRTWRDWLLSNLDENGDIPNVKDPIEYLDIQFLSYDALQAAAEYYREKDPQRAQELTDKALLLRDNTLKDFWMEDKHFFSIAKDRKNGERRTLKSMQSNPGWMLNTGFFDELPEEQKQKYIGSIVKEMFSNDFLVNTGIRSSALSEGENIDVVAYHGSYSSWPVDSFMFAKGLRKQGFPQLAEQIENRLINTINMAGVHYEFFIIDKEGKVLLNPKNNDRDAERVVVDGRPEKTIAWTVTAILNIKRRKGLNEESDMPQEEWKNELEEEILTQIPNIPVYKTRKELEENLYAQPNIKLDLMGGLLKSFLKVIRETIAN